MIYETQEDYINIIRKTSSYQFTGRLIGWNFTTDRCITINSGTADAVKPILKLP